jgi:D-alanyl-lipoteichoic acid acyltransferase DltB (MBOAT superfamily)
MLFNSRQFLIFLPIVIGLYFSMPHRYRWVLLLGASYYFYMCWKPEYVLLIILSTVIDYYAALGMGKHKEKTKRKPYLLLSLLVNIGILFSFKYFNFFNENIRVMLTQFNVFYDAPTFKLLLPVGISFYTFQTLSYSIDVYRGARDPERHFGIFAVYVSYFPQLVAGPIERSTTLLPQFHHKHDFDVDRAVSGLRRIMWGMFQKVVVADRLAIYVDSVYNNQAAHGGLTLIVATTFFVFQVYCDFAGYSNIAIGSARIMGFDLMENFRRPFFARSVTEFWQRWHISLLTWFRDYLYIPMGGNRVPRWRWYFNTLFIFTLCGLWHGAAWTYVITLGLHGAFIVFANATTRPREALVRLIRLDRVPLLHAAGQIFMTFTLFAFSLVFFRALSVADATSILSKMFDFSYGFFVGQPSTFIFSVFAIIALMTVDTLQEFYPGALGKLRRQPLAFRFSTYAFITILVIMIGVFDGGQFIYFQF